MRRKTKQRSAIEAAILGSSRPLSIDEIHQAASSEIPTLGVATVYRTIKRLLESGTIRSVTAEGTVTFYERSDLPHHHHFYCQDCQKLFDIEGCPGNLGTLAPAGSHVTGHEINLFGQCPECNAQ